MSEYYKVQHDLEFREFDTYEEALKFYRQRLEWERGYYEQYGEGMGYNTFEDYLINADLRIYKMTDVTPR